MLKEYLVTCLGICGPPEPLSKFVSRIFIVFSNALMKKCLAWFEVEPPIAPAAGSNWASGEEIWGTGGGGGAGNRFT